MIGTDIIDILHKNYISYSYYVENFFKIFIQNENIYNNINDFFLKKYEMSLKENIIGSFKSNIYSKQLYFDIEMNEIYYEYIYALKFSDKKIITLFTENILKENEIYDVNSINLFIDYKDHDFILSFLKNFKINVLTLKFVINKKEKDHVLMKSLNSLRDKILKLDVNRIEVNIVLNSNILNNLSLFEKDKYLEIMNYYIHNLKFKVINFNLDFKPKIIKILDYMRRHTLNKQIIINNINNDKTNDKILNFMWIKNVPIIYK